MRRTYLLIGAILILDSAHCSETIERVRFIPLKLNRRAITLLILVGTASLMFLTAVACAWQATAAELKIVGLEGDTIIRIDPDGSVFDDIDRRKAVINDRDGSFTLLKDQRKFSFRNDPALQIENDRYIVKIGDGFTFDVKPDGSIFLDGKQWGRVFGYTQNEAQKNRFMAAVVMIPFIQMSDIDVSLPHYVKNADHDKTMGRQLRISILEKDEIYVGDERIPKADLNSQLGERIDESLKKQSEANRIVNIAGGLNVEWGTIVHVLASVREKVVHRIGLIVNSDLAKDRFLVEIPPSPDPNADISKLTQSPLPLGVVISTDLQVKLITGGLVDANGQLISLDGKAEAKGTVNDPSDLTQTLARIFQARKEQHVYRAGMKARTDLAEDERVEKTIVIKAPRSSRYGDVIKIIDAVKGAGASPIILQLDDLSQ